MCVYKLQPATVQCSNFSCLSLLIHAQDFRYFDAAVCKVQWFNAEFIDLKSEARTDGQTDGAQHLMQPIGMRAAQ